jgi:pimeloyl-ACP methyl ester carboxylesterase
MEIRSVEVDGQMLRVGIRQGSAVTPPLLIFNGIGANLELVEPFVAALEGVETVIFDVPGVGGSPLPPRPYRLSHLAHMAAALVAKLGYQGQVDVLGVSWGGALAQQFAHLYPDRCRRLILASTSPGAIMVPGRLSALAGTSGRRAAAAISINCSAHGGGPAFRGCGRCANRHWSCTATTTLSCP